jgi:hypothetical protein
VSKFEMKTVNYWATSHGCACKVRVIEQGLIGRNREGVDERKLQEALDDFGCLGDNVGDF